MVKTSSSNGGGVGSIPGWGAKIPHASWPKNQNIKNKSNIVTNSIRLYKMVHIKNKNKNKKTENDTSGSREKGARSLEMTQIILLFMLGWDAPHRKGGSFL